jgi:ADP-heptose:LPS heptosyltransferase
MINEIKNFFKKIVFCFTSQLITKILCDDILNYGKKNYFNEKLDISVVKRLLIIRLDAIGDFVLFTPFLRELRQNLPNAWISLIVNPIVFNLARHCPYVDEVLQTNWHGDRDMNRFSRHWLCWRMAMKKLAHHKFDLAILPRRGPSYSHDAFLAYFSGARYRIAYSNTILKIKLPYYRNNDSLLTHLMKDIDVTHEVESNLDFLRSIGGSIKSDYLELWPTSKDRICAKNLLSSYKITKDDFLVALAPGKWDPKRRWPVSRFIDLALWLNEKYKAKFIIFGGNEDISLGWQIHSALNDSVINLAGQTALYQAFALLENCALFIGNDSGPKHLAAAAGIPSIEINYYPLDGLSSHFEFPGHFSPWKVPHRILQPKTVSPPCSHLCKAKEAHCISTVTVEDVKKTVRDILSEA